jgi:hypothetical protein
MQLFRKVTPEVMEKMRRISGRPAGRIELILFLKEAFRLPDLNVFSYMSIPNHAPRQEKKVWLTGVVPGVVIIDGQDFDPRLYGLLSRGNGHALFSLLPFEDEEVISLNLWRDPVTDAVVKAYGRDYPVWTCWSLTQGNGMANGGFAIHQDQWRELEPWLRKYLPHANAQKIRPAFAG